MEITKDKNGNLKDPNSYKLKKLCDQYKNKSLKNIKTDLSYILITIGFTIGLVLFVTIIYILYKKFNYLIYKAYYRGRILMYPNNKSFDYTNPNNKVKWVMLTSKDKHLIDCSKYVPYKVK